MYPLSTVATGFVLIVLDLRFNQFDVLLDPLGWGMVIVGLGRLSRSVDPQFKASWQASIVAAVLSLPDVVGVGPAVLYLGYAIVGLVAVWLIATAIMHRAQAAGDAAVASAFDRLRWLLALTQLFGLIAIAVGIGPFLLVALLVALGVDIWFIVRMYRSAKRPYLTIADAAQPGGTGWL